MNDTLPALPEPRFRLEKETTVITNDAGRKESVCFAAGEPLYTADQVRAIIAECRRPAANGDAVAWRYRTNGVHWHIDAEEPPDDAYDPGTLSPLFTAPPPAVPAGWKLVPVEPTPEMLLAFWGNYNRATPPGGRTATDPRGAYRAMIDSAPLAGKGETK